MNLENREVEQSDIKCPLCLEIQKLRQERQKLNKIIRQQVRRDTEQSYKSYEANLAARRNLRRIISKLSKKDSALEAELKDLILVCKPLTDRIRNATKRAFKDTPDGKSYQSINREVLRCISDHPKCNGCSLYFGEHHLASEALRIEGLTFCHYCLLDHERFGRTLFLKRIKVVETEDDE